MNKNSAFHYYYISLLCGELHTDHLYNTFITLQLQCKATEAKLDLGSKLLHNYCTIHYATYCFMRSKLIINKQYSKTGPGLQPTEKEETGKAKKTAGNVLHSKT